MGSISFNASIFSNAVGIDISHWVSLQHSAYDDDFRGEIYEDEVD